MQLLTLANLLTVLIGDSRLTKLMKRQKEALRRCGLYIKYEDIVEVESITYRSEAQSRG
jgi:hypothetical protein